MRDKFLYSRSYTRSRRDYDDQYARGVVVCCEGEVSYLACLHDCLIACMLGYLLGCLLATLLAWLLGWLVSRLVGCLLGGLLD